MKLPVIVVFAAITALLYGCMAVPIAAVALSGAGIYNTVNPEKNVDIAIADSDLERMRTQMNNVNHLAILASGTAALAFSDVWEKSGKQASIITGQGDPSVLSLSQAKGVLSSSCKKGVDASAYGRSGDVDVNRLSMLIGKANTKINADLYVYNCKTRKLDSCPMVISFNATGQDGNQADRSIGAGLAVKMLAITQ